MNSNLNFKIVILEDDDFYNSILTRFLKKNLEELSLLKGFNLSINSYTSFSECTNNLGHDTDLLFTDYYLNDGFRAPLIIEKLKLKGLNCKVVVMSRTQTLQTSISPILEGASEFVLKNNFAFKNCLDLSEIFISEKMNLGRL